MVAVQLQLKLQKVESWHCSHCINQTNKHSYQQNTFYLFLNYLLYLFATWRGMQDLSSGSPLGIEPTAPAGEAQKLRILTTGPPGNSQQNYILKILWGPCGHKSIWQTEFQRMRNSSKERQDIRNISSLAENGTKEVVLIVIWVNMKEKTWNFTKFLKGMCGPTWQLRLPGSPDSRGTLLWRPHPLISSFHQASTGCRKKNGPKHSWVMG